MRPIHLSDLHFAACSLRGLPVDEQTARLTQALGHADIADRYRKRLRKAHPQMGVGTLTSALGPQALKNERQDQDYLQAMLVVITAILDRAGRTMI